MNWINLFELLSGNVWNCDIDSNRNEANILFIGDVALAKKVGKVIDQNGPEYPIAKIEKNIFSADIISFVLECCLSDGGNTWEPKPVVMRGVARYLDVFSSIKSILVANVANNHFLDYGEIAAIDTIAALQERKILHCGAVASSRKQSPLIITTPGGVVAMLAFAPSAHPLPGSAQINILQGKEDELVYSLGQARGQADVVIVQLHQGVEYSPYVDRRSRLLAHDVVDMGADCVICHHAHVIQAVENYKHAVIFYGIGNFLLDVDLQRYPEAAYTLALRLGLAQGRIVTIAVEPYRLDSDMQVNQLTDTERELLSKKLIVQSKLMASTMGRLRNDIGASSILYRRRFRALFDMVGRKGFGVTCRYYAKRLNLFGEK